VAEKIDAGLRAALASWGGGEGCLTAAHR